MKGCDLPVGSYILHSDKYDEVHLPSLQVKEVLAPNERFMEIDSMPVWAQPAFAGTTRLNSVRNNIYQAAHLEAQNLMIFDPTDGKSNVAVLTILRVLGQHRDCDSGKIDHGAYKIVYIAPMKALVAVIAQNLSNRIRQYGVEVKGLSGDYLVTRQEIARAQVIVTTVEGWNVITLKLGVQTCIHLIKLLIIDEVHLLHDSRSGPILESIIARTVREIETKKECNLRLVGLSVTLPKNYKEVAQFLGVDPNKGLFYFDNSYRSLPLCQQYIGMKYKGMEFNQEFRGKTWMNDICYEKAVTALGKQRVLIFVHSSAEVIATAYAIQYSARLNTTVDKFHKKDKRLYAMIKSVKSTDLKKFLTFGIGIHHNRMAESDRKIVEGLLMDGLVQILVCTSSFAWTVNLLADTVIVKGTYSPEDLMQMLSRAARPTYKKENQAIIISDISQLRHNISIVNGKLAIESQSTLAEQLNAEIVLGTVQNAREACNWIRYNYSYLRMSTNLSRYSSQPDLVLTSENGRAHLIDRAASKLDENNLAKYDSTGKYFQLKHLGPIASYYFISHKTLATYEKHLQPTMTYKDLFQLLSQSEEFKSVKATRFDRPELRRLQKDLDIQDCLDEPSGKINILLEAHIDGLKPKVASLTSDMDFIAQTAERLLRALTEIVLKRGWATLARKVFRLREDVTNGMWDFQTPLPHQVPKLSIEAHAQTIAYRALRIELTMTIDFEWDDKIHGCAEPFWVVVPNRRETRILHHEHVLLKKKSIGEKQILVLTLSNYKPYADSRLSVCVFSDRWPRSEFLVFPNPNPIVYPEDRAFLSPSAFPLPPIHLSSLQNSRYEACYGELKYFTSVPSLAFHALYNSDKNVLVAASTGSDKTTCAEIALFRIHKFKDKQMRVVYIATSDARVNERYHEWEKKFGSDTLLNWEIVALTGPKARCTRLFTKGNIVICTSENLVGLSLSWEKNNDLKQIDLLIIEDIHFVGSKAGQVLETVVSQFIHARRRFKTKSRIIALSAPLAKPNAKDLAEWIEASPCGCFNFGCPEILVQDVEIVDFEHRILVMMKLAYDSIVQHAGNGKPTLVFVPTRKHVQLTAVDLITYSSADSVEKPFLLKPTEELEPFLNQISDETLKVTLRHGVGYLHERLHGRDQDLVAKLFKDGMVQVCVLSSSMCWGVTLSAYLVVIMGTQYYDSGENAQTDYPLADILQMMGHAHHPLPGNLGKCVIFCHTPRKEYYKLFFPAAFPIESHLLNFLHESLCAEVVAETIKEMEHAELYLRSTYMFIRLFQNPNYYNLSGVFDDEQLEGDQLLDALLRRGKNTFADLEATKWVAVQNGRYVSPYSLGETALYYCISYATTEMFRSSLTPQTTMSRLLEILSLAAEYSQLSIEPGEEDVVRMLVNDQKFSFENPKVAYPHLKAHVLLQAHSLKQSLVENLALDQVDVLLYARGMLQAMMPIIASHGWMKLALLVMKASQTVMQGICNRKPRSVEVPKLLWEVEENVQAGGYFEMKVTIIRNDARRPRYPKAKEEGWWLLAGDAQRDMLLGMGRFSEHKKIEQKLKFNAPADPGKRSYVLHFICDSYQGFDQQHDFTLNAMEACGSRGP